jgi:DNA invertase Pin-like site-specific DNA recombinase
MVADGKMSEVQQPKMSKKRAALYLRCSTAGQTTESQSLELHRYCERQNWTITKIYEDHAVSGTQHDRPALNQMLSDAQRGRFDVLVVLRIDRLARSTSHLLEILNLLKGSHVDFCSSTQGIDTTTAHGRMIFTFLGAVSEFERELITERVTAGIARAKENGVQFGRPRVGFDINKALELRKQGISWGQLAKRIGVSSATLRRTIPPLLKSPTAKTGRNPSSNACSEMAVKN